MGGWDWLLLGEGDLLPIGGVAEVPGLLQHEATGHFEVMGLQMPNIHHRAHLRYSNAS